MKKRVFIVHGWDGSPKANWYPWLKTKLEEKGFLVFIPTMPNPEEPKIETWVPCLSKSIGNVDAQTYFVGHSIGCQTILRFLETLPKDKKVGVAVFVAGWFILKNLEDEETKEIAKPWHETPINLPKIKTHLPRSVAIFSDNDPYVSLDNRDDFKNKLGSEIIIEHNMGHFNEVAGITQLPIAFESVLKLAK